VPVRWRRPAVTAEDVALWLLLAIVWLLFVNLT